MMSNLIVERFDRVKVYLEAILSFHRKLNNLPSDILMIVSKGLECSVKNRILKSLQKKLTTRLES